MTAFPLSPLLSTPMLSNGLLKMITRSSTLSPVASMALCPRLDGVDATRQVTRRHSDAIDANPHANP